MKSPCRYPRYVQALQTRHVDHERREWYEGRPWKRRLKRVEESAQIWAFEGYRERRHIWMIWTRGTASDKRRFRKRYARSASQSCLAALSKRWPAVSKSIYEPLNHP